MNDFTHLLFLPFLDYFERKKKEIYLRKMSWQNLFSFFLNLIQNCLKNIFFSHFYR